MDLQQFGASIKQKYPAYKDYSDEEIGQRMLEKYPQYKDRVKTTADSPMSKASGVLRGVGLGIIPDAAATIANVPNLKNITNPEAYKEGFKQNPFMDQQAITDLEKGDATRLKQNAQQSNPTVAMTNVMDVVGGAGALKQGLKYTTKKGTAKLTEQAAKKATAKGATALWDDVSKEIQDEVYNKLGKTAEVRKAVDKILASYTPPLGTKIGENVAKTPLDFVSKFAGEAMKGTKFKRMGGVKAGVKGPKGYLKEIGGKKVGSTYDGPLREPTPYGPDTAIDMPAKLTPEELLNWRRQILAREGSGILKLLQGSDVEQKVSGIARRVFSANLQRIAPGTKIPDALYKMYSKGGAFGGDIPKLAAKYGGGYLALKALGPILGPMLASMVKKD